MNEYDKFRLEQRIGNQKNEIDKLEHEIAELKELLWNCRDEKADLKEKLEELL